MCEVEHDTTGNARDVPVQYAIVFEKASERLDKQWVRADPSTRVSREEYAGIAIGTFIGTRVSFGTLDGE